MEKINHQFCTCFFRTDVVIIQRYIKIKFSNNFFNYYKIGFYVNGVNNGVDIILWIFSTIFFWRQSIFFPLFFGNQNQSCFKTILEIKHLDKSIVSKKRWNRSKVNSTPQLKVQSRKLYNSKYMVVLTQNKTHEMKCSHS